MRKYELDTIFLAAPTTTADRLRKIVSVSSGFIYMISRTGVTGERDSLPGDVEGKVRELKHESRLPVAVGFGISRPEHVQQVWQIADAAVVGSALVHRIEECAGKQGWIDQVLAYANWLKGANNRSTDG
jgi:tryptophan synthase alpha chain